MEDCTPPSLPDESWSQDFAQSIEDQQVRVRDFLSQHESNMSEFDSDLLEKIRGQQADLENFRSAMEHEKQEVASAREEIAEAEQKHESSLADLNREREELEALRIKLEKRGGELEKRRIELEKRGGELDRNTADAESQAASESDELSQTRLETEALREQLAQQESSTAEGRTKISDLESSLAEANEITTNLRQREAESRQEFDARTEQFNQTVTDLSTQQEKVEKLEAQLANTAPEEGNGIGSVDVEYYQKIEIERDQLRQQIKELQESGAGEGSSESSSEEQEHLQARLKLAIADVRELKGQNAELNEKLTEAIENGSSNSPGQESSGQFDWEAQKRKMMEDLDADDASSEDDEQRQQDRLSIEGTIRITDDIVKAKDEELKELKKLLDEQSHNVGNLAVGANAIAEMLDQDDLIVQERERIKATKDELQEKLRVAEVEISMERAKIARDKSQLEQQLREFEDEKARLGERKISGGSSSGEKKPAGNRWLARLGLKNDDE